MGTPEDLDQLCAYAAEVAECATTISVPPEHAARLGELKQLADQIVTEISEPLRIGVVGEFSAGKSLLLGVLLGKPDLLPSSQEPTTGNVTELRFVPAADGAAHVGIDKVAVCFFSRADADVLGQRILADLKEAAGKAGMSQAELAELDEIGAGWTPRFRDWCARAARRDHTRLRKLIRELMLLRDAMAAAPDWLGQTVRISKDQLATILKIRYPNIEQGFPPAPAVGSVPFSETPTDAALVTAFPLVSRVLLDVALPAGRWPLAAVSGGQGFTLLDFPGIGGANTKARDLFLTQRGIEDVHTILVLVDAGHVGSDEPDTFYEFLKDLDRGGETSDVGDRLANRIVYCAGRFDQLSLPDAVTSELGHVDEVDDFGPEPGTRTVDWLLTEFTAFNALLQSGHRPGLSAMRAFASSVLAIARLGLPDVPAELDLEAHRGTAEKRAAQWQQVAEEFLTGGSRERELAGPLLGYTKDGGVEQLRRLLELHVRDNGLQLRIDKAEKRLDGLDELKADLITVLRNSPVVASEASSNPNVLAIELRTALRLRAQRLARDTARLRDPAQVPLAPHWSVRQDVLRAAADQVLSWPEWNEIIGCVRNGIVVPSAQSAGLTDLERALDGDDWDDRAGQERLPQQLGDFEDSYRKSCDALRGYACDVALAGTKRWLEERSAETRDLQRQASALLDAAALERLARLGRGHQTGIARILRPELVADGLARRTKEQAKLPEVPPFPLRTEQPTSWAEGTLAEDGARHFMGVLRLRGALIDAVADYALGCLDAVQDLIATQLRDLYDKGQPSRLPDQRKFVAAVVGTDTGVADKLPNPAAALEALARPGRDSVFGDRW